MFRKCYIAIVSDKEGKPVGSIMTEIRFYRNAHFAYKHIIKNLDKDYHIIKFERVK